MWRDCEYERNYMLGCLKEDCLHVQVFCALNGDFGIKLDLNKKFLVILLSGGQDHLNNHSTTFHSSYPAIRP